MTVTIKDIARRTGKSITTVSRALNDYDDVSDETKARVRRVADELGYKPSLLARRLQKRRTEIIGLIMPTYGPRFSDPFFSEFMAGVGNLASSHGYGLFVSTVAPGPEELDEYVLRVEEHYVDGFVIVRTRKRDIRMEWLSQLGIPFAAFGRCEGEIDYPYVDVDGFEGMRMIAHHLADRGHHRIGVIASPPDLMFTHHRLSGLELGLEECGLALDGALILNGELTQASGYAAAQRLLERDERPTALVAFNDLMGLGAMSAAHALGLQVGPDVAVTGFDDISLAEHAHPPLTTIHQPVYRIGRQVCELLIDTLEDRPIEQRQVVLQPSLVLRQSSQHTFS